jgi:hypothetical protein
MSFPGRGCAAPRHGVLKAAEIALQSGDCRGDLVR